MAISSGGRELGAVLLLGRVRAEVEEYLHMAAIAALTEVAVVEARDETEQSLRGSFLEEALERPDLDPTDLERRAARLGCDLRAGYTALCADSNGRAPAPGGRAGRRGARRPRPADAGKVYALLPGDPRSPDARPPGSGATPPLGSRPTTRARRTSGARSRRPTLVLGVTVAGGGAPVEEIGAGTYRLLFRVMASHPQEVRSFYEDTVSPLVRYDEQYSTDLMGTLDSLPREQLQHERHRAGDLRPHVNVGYRLERIKS